MRPLKDSKEFEIVLLTVSQNNSLGDYCRSIDESIGNVENSAFNLTLLPAC